MFENMTFYKYAKKWKRPIGNNFAIACFERYTKEELITMLDNNYIDEDEMFSWEINENEEYLDAIATAIYEKHNK